ncbi:hypothetical protein AGR1B_pTi0071 [Agrobacterium fabacearum S56]|nr:hypothetical protein AGR1B_pTi0071 [Agrobacterium fabacearum S56]
MIIAGRFTAKETFPVDLFTAVNTEASLDEVRHASSPWWAGFSLSIRMAVYWINPINLFRLLYRIDIRDVDDDCLVVRSHQDALEHVVRIGIDFLVRYVRRHEDEVAWSRLRDIFQMIPPAHTGLATDHENNAFERTVVVDPGLGVRLDCDGACPDFLCADAGMIDGCLPEHARRLGRVGIELVALDDTDPVVLPMVRVMVVVVMVVAHGAVLLR